MDKPEMDSDATVVFINGVRSDIKKLAATLDAARRSEFQGRAGENRGEMLANLTLAYRHLEDASMRLGKAIQARDGGVSVYDRATTVGA